MEPAEENSLESTDASTRVSERIYCSLTGIEVTTLTKKALLSSFGQLLNSSGLQVIVGHNLHSAYLYHSDGKFRSLYDNAAVVLADGKPVQIDAKRTLKKINSNTPCERIGSTDWLVDAITTYKPKSIAVVGTRAEINRDFVALLQDLSPKSIITGIPGSDWNPDKAKTITKDLRDISPDLVILGLGMPLQEHFMEDNKKELPHATYVLVGGAIDQLTGYQKNAPRWMGNLGIEWLWRLGSQPLRLGNRYLVEPWKLVLTRLSSGSGSRVDRS